MKQSSLDASRGGTFYLFLHLQYSLLLALQRDMIRYQEKGIEEHECDNIKRVLAELGAMVASTSPEAELTLRFSKNYTEICGLYRTWNDEKKIPQSAFYRNRAAAEFKKLRIRIRKKVARHKDKERIQLELSRGKLVSIYLTLHTLLCHNGVRFPALFKAYRRVAKGTFDLPRPPALPL